jgi:hypothetical protein
MNTEDKSSAMQKRRLFFDNIEGTIPVTTKERKEIILNQETYLIYHGIGYDIKFKNLGGGLYNMYTEPHQQKKINQP